MPFMLCLFTVVVYSLQGRFVLSQLVNDKESKMRETLRIMSLSRVSYSLSYFVMQGLVSILSSVIMCSWVVNITYYFPDGGIYYMLVCILFGLANISFTMALSTLFADSKLADQFGGLLLILPTALYL